MDIIQQIIDNTISSFDFGFCISVNILTYLIIKLLDKVTKSKSVTTIQRKLVLLVSIFVLGVAYYFIGADVKLVLNSAILAPVFWSWIGKPIINKLGLGYNDKQN